jgi:hypothetical protein
MEGEEELLEVPVVVDPTLIEEMERFKSGSEIAVQGIDFDSYDKGEFLGGESQVEEKPPSTHQSKRNRKSVVSSKQNHRRNTSVNSKHHPPMHASMINSDLHF